jgi:hypothetical protein
MSWVEAFENVRHDDSSDAAAFTPGLTPHARGLRRLHAATRELQGDFKHFDDATTAGERHCVTWVYNCFWGFTYTYKYEVVNWNYDAQKKISCQEKNILQCDRSKSSSIQLAGQFVTCRSCFAYLGADLDFVLKLNKRTVDNFKFLVGGVASASMDINVNFPNNPTNHFSTTTLDGPRKVGSVTFTAGPIPMTIDFNTEVSIELSATCLSSGRIVGPGFWYQDQAEMGKSYRNGIWINLNNVLFVMEQRSPSIDIQVSASMKARLIFDIEFSVKLMSTVTWPLHFYLAPSLSADLTVDTRCAENKISIALYSQVEGKVKIDGPKFTILGIEVELFSPLIDSNWINLLDKKPFTCVGCTGCVSRTGAPAVNITIDGSSGSSGSSCTSKYISGSWSTCSGSCGTGIQTRTVTCRDCNNYTSSSCSGTSPVKFQTCNTGKTCPSGPLVMTSYSSESSSIVTASYGDGYRKFKVIAPSRYVNFVSGDEFSYQYFAIALEIYAGNADLYLYSNNPPYWPYSDGSLCGCIRGSSDVGGCSYNSNQALLWGTSCKTGTETDLMDLKWTVPTSQDVFLVVAGRGSISGGQICSPGFYCCSSRTCATSYSCNDYSNAVTSCPGFSISTSLYSLTTVYYYKLKSSLPLVVPSTIAIKDSKQVFQFRSSTKASGFIIFATPTIVGVGDPDIYCSKWDFADLPTVSTAQITAVNLGAEALSVSDPSTFSPNTDYAIMINSFAAGAYSVEVADIYTLEPGISSGVMSLDVANAAVYFIIQVPVSADQITIILTSIVNDADIYVNNKQFRSGGVSKPCNCAYKSERGGSDIIHMDWLDPEWSTTLYVSIMSKTSSASFTVTAYPVYVMGEAEIYRVPASFVSSTFLLSGEGRSPLSVYSPTGHTISDNTDYVYPSLPSSMSTCSIGRRLNEDSLSKYPSGKHVRELSFDSPNTTSPLGYLDTYVFGARSSSPLAMLEADVMSWKVAKNYPTCFITPPTGVTLPGSFNVFRGSFSGKSLSKISLDSALGANGFNLADSPMIASLKLISAEVTSTGQRRVLQITNETQATSEDDFKSSIKESNHSLIGEAPPVVYGNREQTTQRFEEPLFSSMPSAPLWDILSDSVSAYSLLDSHNRLHIEPPKTLGFDSQTFTKKTRRLQTSTEAKTSSIDVISAPDGSTVGSTKLMSTFGLFIPPSMFSTNECPSTSPCLSITIPEGSFSNVLSLKVKIPASLAEVTISVQTLLVSSLAPVSTSVRMSYSLSFPTQKDSSGRSITIREPFWKPYFYHNPGRSTGLFSNTFSNCETTYSSLNGEAAVFVDIVGFSTAGGAVRVDISVDSSSITCPSYFWNSNQWSTCDNTDCASLVGTKTRWVWCESSTGERFYYDAANICKADAAIPSTMPCTRSNSCVAPTTTSLSSGSISGTVDVMSYTARALQLSVKGPTIELPSLVSGAWLYNYESDTSWRQFLSPTSIAMCLEVSLKPISKFFAGCGYHQLIAVYECQKSVFSCLEARASGDLRCNCYSEAMKCFSNNICDNGIKQRSDYIFSLYQGDVSSGKVPSSCIINSLSSLMSPVMSHTKGLAIGSWQVLLSSYGAASSESVQAWFAWDSIIINGTLLSSSNGNAEQTVFIPLQLSQLTALSYSGLSPTTIKSVTVMLRPTAEFQTSVKISPLRWDNANDLVTGPMILSESDIRTGGSSWLIKIQCDTFLDAAFNTSSRADALSSFVMSSFMSNVSQTIESVGWVGAVIPIIKRGPIVVSLVDSISVRVTLPPVPLFRLTSSSEAIIISIPGRFLSSGQTQVLPATKIIIKHSSRNCVVGPWSVQGTLPLTTPQYFKRTRSIITNHLGFGDVCPALEQTSTILATRRDANCSFVSCGGRGVCLQNTLGVTTCSCNPGIYGVNSADCSKFGVADPYVSDSLWRASFVSMGSWSSCAPTRCFPSTLVPTQSSRSLSCLLPGNLNQTCGLSPSTSTLPVPILASCSSVYPAISIFTVPLQINIPDWITYLKSPSGWQIKRSIETNLVSRFSSFFGYSLKLLGWTFTDDNTLIITFESYGSSTPPYTDVDSLRVYTRSFIVSFLEKMISYSSSGLPSSDSMFMDSFGIFKTSRSVLIKYINATVYSNTDCRGSGTQVLDLSTVFPTASPSVTPTRSPTPSITPTLSLTPSITPSKPPTPSQSATPSQSPSPTSTSWISAAKVSVIINFDNIKVSSVMTDTGRMFIASAIASTADVDPSKVKITQIINRDTKSVLFREARRLQIASIEVQTVIIVDSAGKAEALVTTMKNIDVSSVVLTKLKTSDPSTYSSVTASASLSLSSPSNTPSTSSSSLSVAILGAIGAGAFVMLLAITVTTYCFCCRKVTKEKETSTPTEAPTSFGVENPMAAQFIKVNPLRSVTSENDQVSHQPSNIENNVQIPIVDTDKNNNQFNNQQEVTVSMAFAKVEPVKVSIDNNPVDDQITIKKVKNEKIEFEAIPTGSDIEKKSSTTTTSGDKSPTSTITTTTDEKSPSTTTATSDEKLFSTNTTTTSDEKSSTKTTATSSDDPVDENAKVNTS